MILSLDVGIKNLAFALFESNDRCIHVKDIGTIDLSEDGQIDTKDIESLTKSIIQNVNKRFSSIQLDHVVIENQPALKNPSMKTVQVTLYTLFMLRKVQHENPCSQKVHQVRLYSAMNKLKLSKLLPTQAMYEIENNDALKAVKNEYTRRKKLSIEICMYLIKNGQIVLTDELNIKLVKSKKRDDLCDSLLQGFHFVNAL